MKFSSKIEKCGLSPMRKFAPAAAAAEKRGVKIYRSARYCHSNGVFRRAQEL